ncbi:MAG TPA: SMP-30/gluconolactonase/LRE family protein, partial [Thermoanaerobaculia bacterium]
RFNFPTDVAIDTANNVYVADSQNHTIRKISAAGVVTTMAGLAGTNGQADGTGSAARFWVPSGVAVEPSGANVYVTDRTNHTIRRITAAGVVTTFAGKARSNGQRDGFGEQASFYYPYDIVMGPTGDMYVADSYDHSIRKVTPDGRVTTIAGDGTASDDDGSRDGTGAAARFSFPSGVAVAGNGDVWVVDTSNQTIRKITPAGVVTTIAGRVDTTGINDGAATAARFRYPHAIAVTPNGNVVIADTENHTIRYLDVAALQVTTFAGHPAVYGFVDAQGSAARFFFPTDVAFDSAGNLYVTDNHAIRKVTPAGVVTTFAGNASVSGAVDGVGAGARFRYPSGVAVGPGDVVYVADTDNHTIRKITPDGTVTTLAGLAGQAEQTNGTGSAARFDSPFGLTVDDRGNVYVADTYNHAIRMVEPTGVVTSFAGLGRGYPGSKDAVGTSATFRYPSGIAIDGARNLYVADWGNDIIRKITPSGVVTTFAGTFYAGGSNDGIGTDARFSEPRDVAVTAAGVVYVADTANHTIRRISPSGQVTTVAGRAGSAGNVDGLGAAARFHLPTGIAVSSTGRVAVVDTLNHNVRVGDAAPPQILSLTLSVPAIDPGESAVLHWWTADGTTVSIDNGIGTVEATGTRVVRPTQTTRYTLTVTGPGGTVTKSIELLVVKSGPRKRSVRH